MSWDPYRILWCLKSIPDSIIKQQLNWPASRELGNVPRPPNVALLRALWSLLVGIWDILKGSWGVLVDPTITACLRHPNLAYRSKGLEGVRSQRVQVPNCAVIWGSLQGPSIYHIYHELFIYLYIYLYQHPPTAL